jgi:hypothetical protein
MSQRAGVPDHVPTCLCSSTDRYRATEVLHTHLWHILPPTQFITPEFQRPSHLPRFSPSHDSRSDVPLPKVRAATACSFLLLGSRRGLPATILNPTNCGVSSQRAFTPSRRGIRWSAGRALTTSSCFRSRSWRLIPMECGFILSRSHFECVLLKAPF